VIAQPKIKGRRSNKRCRWVVSTVEWEIGGQEVKMEEKRPKKMVEVAVAVACSVRLQELRPTMGQVVKMLQEVKEAAVMEDCG